MADAVAEVLAMLLPPGILFDSPQIYAEVAKLPIVPLEDIRRHWHGTPPPTLWVWKRSRLMHGYSVHIDVQEVAGSNSLPSRALLVACLGQ